MTGTTDATRHTVIRCRGAVPGETAHDTARSRFNAAGRGRKAAGQRVWVGRADSNRRPAACEQAPPRRRANRRFRRSSATATAQLSACSACAWRPTHPAGSSATTTAAPCPAVLDPHHPYGRFRLATHTRLDLIGSHDTVPEAPRAPAERPPSVTSSPAGSAPWTHGARQQQRTRQPVGARLPDVRMRR
jgi:hypothetical protein